MTFDCLKCGGSVGVTRPELPIERHVCMNPCGYVIVISTKGRWDTSQVLLFECLRCGQEHRIEKR